MADEEFVIDEFQLINSIATGTHTHVWDVTEQGGSEHFAMKLLLPEAFENPVQLANIKSEAKVSGSFEHPNVIKFHKFVKNKKHAYMILEYFRAPNLRQQLSGDLFGVQSRVKKLVETTCQALGHLHEKGWVHKDVKPENILFNKSSEMRLVDFGLSARAASGLSKIFSTKKAAIQGTMSYIAPETVRKQPITAQTDIYSLGVVFFEVLTGKTPFQGTTPKDLLIKHVREPAPSPSMANPNITPEADRFILKMLAKKPADRHASVQEVNSEFRNLKVFKEDVEEIRKRRDEAEKSDGMESLKKELDSRADAERQRLIRENPEMAKELVVERRKKSNPPVVVTSTSQSEPQPPQQPQVPQQPMPGTYAPQQPGIPVAGQQPPMGYPQQVPMMPQPQYPQVPPQPYYPPAGQQYVPQVFIDPQTGQPIPQGQMMPQMPPQQIPPPPAVSPPGHQQPPSPPPAAKQPGEPHKQVVDSNDVNDDDDLPLMEELPDVL